MASINAGRRSLAGEYSKTLSAQLGILPNMLSGQAEWQPVSTSNTLGNLNQLMLGTPELNYDTQEYTPSVWKQGRNYGYGALPPFVQGGINYPELPQSPGGGGGGGGFGGFGGGFPGIPPTPGQLGISWGGMQKEAGGPGAGPNGPYGGYGGAVDPKSSFGNMFPPGPFNPDNFLPGNNTPNRVTLSPGGYSTTHHTLGAQQGLLSLYRDYMAPALNQVQSAQRESDIADVGRLGPQAMAALKASDPETANLLDTLTSSAQSQLASGTSMDPGMQRGYEQSLRGAQAARGMGYGPSDVFNESLGMTQFGNQLRQQRQQLAGGVAGLRQSIYGDPFQRILGRNSAGVGAASGAMGQAMGMLGGGAGNFLNPESSYAGDLYNTNFNAMFNSAIANANNKNSMIGAGIGALGSLGGGAMGMFGM